jgi:hypothetical protein
MPRGGIFGYLNILHMNTSQLVYQSENPIVAFKTFVTRLDSCHQQFNFIKKRRSPS